MHRYRILPSNLAYLSVEFFDTPVRSLQVKLVHARAGETFTRLVEVKVGES
jgi:hypothetical protein